MSNIELEQQMMNKKMMTAEQQLFGPFELKGNLLKNRIVMAPLTRSRAYENLPNELMTKYYTQRVSAGLIISESIVPSPNALGYPRIAGLYRDEHIAGWKKVTDAIHEKGGLIFAQLNHPGRVGTSENFPEPAKIISASAISADINVFTDHKGLVRSDKPEALDAEGIKITIGEFIIAARNAIAAGFDGVEIHGANGYLLEQFLNPHVNNRTDEYGGSIENRCRFILEIVEKTAMAIGRDKVGLRLSPFNTLFSMPHYEEIRETYCYLAKEVNRSGILYLHLIDAVTRLGQDPDLLGSVEQLFSAIRQSFSGCMILNGGYTKERALRAIERDQADLISFGVLFISNPDLPYRLQHDLPLEAPEPAYYYAGGEKGFTDYPKYSA